MKRLQSILMGLLTIGLVYSAASLAVGIKGKNRTFPYGCRVMGYSYTDDMLIVKPDYAQNAQPSPNQPQNAQNPQTPGAQNQDQKTADEAAPTQANATKQTMFLIHNKSMQSLEIKSKKFEGQMYKPDNDNVIGPNQWAAFAMDEPEVQFICSNNGKTINCSNVLEVCEYNHAKFSDSTMGTYWVVKSDTLENAVYGAIHIGILLRW